jgi:dTDP-4-amino-4,6-dideoxygalactose transaminase
MQEMGFGEGTFPVAEAAADSVLSLPVHPSLSDDDVAYIAEAVNRLTS